MPGESRKFVVVLNKRRNLSSMLSAIGHVTAGIAGGNATREELSLVTYTDADGNEYPSVSDWPFLVLRGGPGQLKNLRTALRDEGLPCVAYLDTMLSGGSELQQSRTADTPEEDLEILAVATFGAIAQLDPFTKKFSVWQ